MTISEEKEEFVGRRDKYARYPFGEDSFVKFRNTQYTATDGHQCGFGYLFGWASAFPLKLEGRAYP